MQPAYSVSIAAGIVSKVILRQCVCLDVTVICTSLMNGEMHVHLTAGRHHAVRNFVGSIQLRSFTDTRMCATLCINLLFLLDLLVSRVQRDFIQILLQLEKL